MVGFSDFLEDSSRYGNYINAGRGYQMLVKIVLGTVKVGSKKGVTNRIVLVTGEESGEWRLQIAKGLLLLRMSA